jgi:hypothetical protein
MFGVLAIALVVGVLAYTGSVNGNSSPTATLIATPKPNVIPTITMTPTPPSNPTATPNSTLTVTYSEIARNQTLIAIQFKLEPNSYIFQLNATSFNLNEGNTIISTNTNGSVVVGTQ